MYPIEVFQTSLQKLVDVFRQFGVRFHLTGGITSVAYGEPRMTQDIDIVIDRSELVAKSNEFLEVLQRRGFHLDKSSARRAIETGEMFQVFDVDEALKMDLYPRELIPGELSRSRMVEIFAGNHLPIASLPDVALSKLIWIDKGSHKSRRDLRQLLRRANDDETSTIREGAKSFGLDELLDQVIGEADEY